MPFQLFEDANMRCATGTAATQNKADTRPLGVAYERSQQRDSRYQVCDAA
jgi:hypothetical protein